MADSQDTMRWVWRGVALFVLLFGWVFIAWQNRFHLSAPVVVICLGYLAVVATVGNLWRTGAAAVAEDDADSTWAKPVGALSELEREKRTLLKAIKEAEFDHQMGKLSKADVDHMVATYRGRAIEVYKEIERLETGHTGTAREQIMREVRARIELEGKAAPKAKAGGKKAKASATTETAAATEATAETETAAAAETDTASAETEAAAAAAMETGADADAAADAVADARMSADELLDADSTTALEPKREPVKEAMR